MDNRKPQEKPILFSTEMVKDILSGKKKQTRRIIKPFPQYHEKEKCWDFGWAQFYDNGFVHTSDENGIGGQNWNANDYPHENKYSKALEVTPFEKPCPFGNAGDKLWVRENFMYDNVDYVQLYKKEKWRGMPDRFNAECFYEASEEHPDMFKWRPSIHMPRWASRLTLDILSIRAERLQDGGDRDFWGEENWALNNWVWVVEFKVAK